MPGSFDDLPLAPELRRAVRDLGFAEPTPVQAEALPPALAGRDVLGRARTGTGKTAAYGLPLLQRLALERRRVQALVLCPTRELALQVTSELRRFGKRSPGLRVVTVVGGQPGEHQARALAEGAHVVVGTPGRTLDHLRRGTLDPTGVAALVLDEADRLLELGFATELEAIRALLPADRQTALFSATMPAAVLALSAGWQRDAVTIEADDAPPAVAAFAAVVADPRAALDALLRAERPEAALVFADFKRVVAETADALARAGHDATALHGDLAQEDRDRVMAAFRNGSVRVLVATDVAGRGLDVEGLPLVVNLELPARPEDYLHRVGRTGRAGKAGLAWTLLSADRELPEGVVRSDPPVPSEGAPPLASAWATLEIGAGRRDKLRPADLLGALTGDCGLAAADVGRFEIGDRRSFVAVARKSVAAALRGLTRRGVKGRRVRAERTWPGGTGR